MFRCTKTRHSWLAVFVLALMAERAVGFSTTTTTAASSAAASFLRQSRHHHQQNRNIISRKQNRRTPFRRLASELHQSSSSDADDWIDLTPDGGVQKKVLSSNEEGSGEDVLLETDSTVTIQYTGTLAESNWTPQEVVSCWLSQQQGLDDLKEAFLEHAIDEATLTNVDGKFTEAFVTDTLGVSQKIKCKKLVLAAKRLRTTRDEFPAGTQFDQNDNFTAVVGPKGKVIAGMKLGIASMTAGESCELRIRSDYGYGSEGYRTSKGEVVVPPFATLHFQLTVL